MYVIGFNVGSVWFAYGFYKPGKNTFAFFAEQFMTVICPGPLAGLTLPDSMSFKLKNFSFNLK